MVDSAPPQSVTLPGTRVMENRLPGEHRHTVSPIPPAASAQVWIDFDGTITQRDVLDDLILRYAHNDSWKLIEERWQAGLIGSKECLREEFDLIRVDKTQLREFLGQVKVDPGLGNLLNTLRSHRVPATILSDGIDWFIQAVLNREGIADLPVRSNTLTQKGNRLSLVCPHESATCTSAAAHCKCASAVQLQEAGRRTIYIGDGRSDLCPSRKADAVFAKGTLAQSLTREGIVFTPFVTLNDVAHALQAAWAVAIPVTVELGRDRGRAAAPRSA